MFISLFLVQHPGFLISCYYGRNNQCVCLYQLDVSVTCYPLIIKYNFKLIHKSVTLSVPIRSFYLHLYVHLLYSKLVQWNVIINYIDLILKYTILYLQCRTPRPYIASENMGIYRYERYTKVIPFWKRRWSIEYLLFVVSTIRPNL